MIKKILIGTGVVVVALVVGIYWLSQNAGPIVQAVIEEQGTRATQVPVTLDAVDIDLADLKAGLRGLAVANPPGFETERAISLGAISVKIAKDWSPNLIVIDEVMIDAPEVTYEIGSGGSNIAKIQENVDNFVKAMTGPEQAGSGSTDGGKGNQGGESQDSPKVVINNFYIKHGKVNVSTALFKGKSLTAPLPDIHLQDIGKDDGSGAGATPTEVVEQIITAITDKADGAASSLDLSQLGVADITGKAAEIGGAAKDALEGAGQKLDGAGDQLGGAAKDAGEALGGAVKNLFGN